MDVFKGVSHSFFTGATLYPNNKMRTGNPKRAVKEKKYGYPIINPATSIPRN